MIETSTTRAVRLIASLSGIPPVVSSFDVTSCATAE